MDRQTGPGHTYAAFSIAAGVSLFTLARRMGSSVDQIDTTYGHLLPDAEEFERSLLDAFDARQGDTDADQPEESAVWGKSGGS